MCTPRQHLSVRMLLYLLFHQFNFKSNHPGQLFFLLQLVFQLAGKAPVELLTVQSLLLKMS